MKKIILPVALFGIMSTASASDYVVTEDFVSTTRVSSSYDVITYVDNSYVAPVRYAAPAKRPCNKNVNAPVKVKTHTEVVDHYQVYQPVTVYQPVGTYSERRIVKPCGGCNY